MYVDIFSGKQLTLTEFENGTEVRLTLEKKSRASKVLAKDREER